MSILDKVKQFKLRNIFKRAAKPVYSKDILENKSLRKAIVKHHRKKVFRRIKLAFLASASLSTGLQFAPNLVSKPLDTYMAEKGYPSDFSKNFHTKEIRVYQRGNVLYPFHMAGRETAMLWHETLKEKNPGLIGLTISTPFVYSSALLKGFGDMIFNETFDAYSMSNDDNPATRTNFIRPPADFSLQTYLADFSNIEGKDFKFQHKPEDLKRVIFEQIMLHEARHGDQQKLVYTTANESDADLYAFRVLAARGEDAGLLREAATIVASARAVNATLYGDQAHVSTFALIRGQETIFDAHEEAADFRRLHEFLAEANRMNSKAFPATMEASARYFYLTAALEKVGVLDEDPGLKRAAEAYVSAIAYFDHISGGKILDQKFSTKVDFTYLIDEYKPVPDKLPTAPAVKQADTKQDTVKPAPLKPAA